MRARYIRLASRMQCNPVVASLAILIAAGIMSAAEIEKHETGIFQALRGAAAGTLTLAVLISLRVLARWVLAQDAPRESAAPGIPLVDETAVMMAWLSDADREAMAAEAALLAGNDMTVLVSEYGALYGLQDDLADDGEAI